MPHSKNLPPIAIDKLTRLAEIQLSPAERENCSHYLQEMVTWLSILAEPDLTEVPPTLYGLEQLHDGLHDDLSRPGLPPESVLALAPQRTASEFRVPKIVE